MQVDTDQQSDDELAINIPAIGIYVQPNSNPDTLAGAILRAQRQIGRASCRERVCLYV